MERILAWYRVGSSYGALIALIVANAIPLTRRLTAPSTNGSPIPTATTKASVGQMPHSQRVSAIAVPAPTPPKPNRAKRRA